MEIKHKENHSRGIFYTEDEKGIIGELTYNKEGSILTIDHTEVRREREGEGIASKLLERSVQFARENNYKINPLCPFAEVKFDEIDAYSDVRA